MNTIAIIFIFAGVFIVVESYVHLKSVIGFTHPARIVWWNYDGSIYHTESVPIGIDPHEYARSEMRLDTRKVEYYVIDGG